MGVLAVIIWGYFGAKNKIKALNYSYIIYGGLIIVLDGILSLSAIQGASTFLLWVGVDIWLIFCGIKGLRRRK